MQHRRNFKWSSFLTALCKSAGTNKLDEYFFLCKHNTFLGGYICKSCICRYTICSTDELETLSSIYFKRLTPIVTTLTLTFNHCKTTLLYKMTWYNAMYRSWDEPSVIYGTPSVVIQFAKAKLPRYNDIGRHVRVQGERGNCQSFATMIVWIWVGHGW